MFCVQFPFVSLYKAQLQRWESVKYELKLKTEVAISVKIEGVRNRCLKSNFISISTYLSVQPCALFFLHHQLIQIPQLNQTTGLSEVMPFNCVQPVMESLDQNQLELRRKLAASHRFACSTITPYYRLEFSNYL